MGDSVEYLLMELGYTGLESEAYLAVLAEPDSTGYRISQVLGKPAPNIYKALDSLVTKGAILADEGSRSRTFTAVPVREQVKRINHRLDEIASDIEDRLDRMYKPLSEDGVYKLTSVHQTMAKAEQMLGSSSESLIVSADETIMERLRSSLERAAKRGVEVLLQGKSPVDIQGCHFINTDEHDSDDGMLVVVSDRKEYLVAFMSSDMRSLIQGIWSRNIIAPCLHRCYLFKAMVYRTAMMIDGGDSSLEALGSELKDFWSKWGHTGNEYRILGNYLKKGN